MMSIENDLRDAASPDPDHGSEELSFDDDVNEGKRARGPGGRRPTSTAERRATHNAVERARRESLNSRFMDLAGALPNMANVKRPSKSAIVAKSLEFVQTALGHEAALVAQNDALRVEVNELRARLGLNTLPAAAMPVSMPTPPASAGLPLRGRELSIGSASAGSSSGGASPRLGGTSPASSGSSFDAASAQLPPYQSPPQINSAFLAHFGQPAVPPQQAKLPEAFAATAPTFAPLDINYLMALSMQQQQQQQALAMQSLQANEHIARTQAPWTFPLNTSADTTSWIFG